MRSVVYVRTWANYLTAAGRVDRELDWFVGLTLADVVPKERLSEIGFQVLHNGTRAQNLARALEPGDHVDLVVRPGWAAVGAFIVDYVVPALIAAAISVVVSLIIGRPRGPKGRGDNDGHYAWDGLSNSRGEGQPLMVIYGETRVAPQVIDEFVTVDVGKDKSVLHQLLQFGEGPIHSIGGVEIDTIPEVPRRTDDPENPIPDGLQVNGNNLDNFNHAIVHVRLGTSEQEHIPGFDYIATDYEVGATLTQINGESDTPQTEIHPDIDLVDYSSNDPAQQAVWDEYGFAFDMTEEADAYSILINFPQGLYKVASSGALTAAGFQMLIRYMRLDGLGVPIIAGGNNGDGWVYVPPQALFLEAHQAPITLSFDGGFYDPDAPVTVVPGKALDCNGASRYAATADLLANNLPADWDQNQNPDGVTVSAWVKLTSVAEGGLIGWGGAAGGGNNKKGFGIGVSTNPFEIGQPLSWRAVYGCDNGEYSVYGSVATAGEWKHVVWTYAKDPVFSVRARTRIYIDGVMVGEQTFNNSGNDHLAVDGIDYHPIEIGRSPFYFLAGHLPALFDEVIVSDREWSANEVFVNYNFGFGVFGTSNSHIVGAWHFETEVPAGVTEADYGPRGNDLTVFSGGATSGLTDGIVPLTTTGLFLRSRYRVQCLRVNVQTDSSRLQSESVWTVLYGKVSEKLTYPTSPLIGLELQATEQLNSSTPTTTAIVKGRKCPIWDGIDEANPNVVYEWTANPAWIALDMVTNTIYGRGQEYPIEKVDLASVKRWADYCDELVYDAKGQKKRLHESDVTAPLSTLVYDSTMFSSFGGLVLTFRLGTSFIPPSHWVVGAHLGFRDLPVINVDINIDNIGGFEIGDVTFNGVWSVHLRYDKATYGDPWLDGQDMANETGTTVDGTVEGREVRFRYDGVRDTFRGFWPELMDVCATARGMPIPEGDRIRFKFERPRSPVAMLTMANIAEGSFKWEYTDKTATPNHYTCDFHDRDLNWAWSPAERSDEELSASELEENVVRESIRLEGVTRRSQVMRHMWFLLKTGRIATKLGTFKAGLDTLAIEVGDVVQVAHDLVPWGKSGRLLSGVSTTQVTLDRSITIPADPTYLKVHLGALGQVVTDGQAAHADEVRQVSTAAGTYPAGSTITVSAPFSAVPAKGDTYTVYQTPFLAAIVECTLGENFEREFKWVAYSDAIYDVDTLPEDVSSTIGQTSSDPPSRDTIPGTPSGVRLLETVVRLTDGGAQSRFFVSWRLEDETASIVAGVRLYARESGGVFRLVAEESGPARSASFVVPEPTPGTEIEVSVCPYSYGGARVPARSGGRASRQVLGHPPAPPAPLAFSATIDLDHAVYEVTPPADARGLSYEIRRGGWILGQPVAVIPEGQSSVRTPNVVGGVDNSYGESAPPLYVRSRDRYGMYSEAVLLADFDPTIVGATVLTGLYSGADNAWEDYAAGAWTNGVAGAPSLSGLQVTAYAGRNVLEFSGSNLEGTYTSGTSLSPTGIRPERVYVEVFAEAEQIHSRTVDELNFGVDSVEADRWTVEGPLVVKAGEPANCTLALELRYKTDPGGAWSDWIAYRPGIVRVAMIQARIRVTRPDTDTQVRIRRFSTRCLRIPRQRRERSPVQVHTYRRILHG